MAEPWGKPTDTQVKKLRERLGDPLLFGLTTSLIRELNKMKLEEIGNFDKRIREVKCDLFLIGKEHGSNFILNLFFKVVEELAKTTEERFAELGNIKEILTEEKPEVKSKTAYTGKITISQLAEKRYGLKLKGNRCKCPFHSGSNKTSFWLDDKKNSFKCWSCGEKGNMVQFVKLMEEIKYG